MASNYPGSLDSFDTIASDKKTSDSVGGRTHRQMHNDLGDAIESVQTELGTNPSGSDATVAARLSAIEAGTNLATGAVTSAKIADGTIATADIADGAVTVAKLGSDVRIGNLLTANQASGTGGGWYGINATFDTTTDSGDTVGRYTLTATGATDFANLLASAAFAVGETRTTLVDVKSSRSQVIRLSGNGYDAGWAGVDNLPERSITVAANTWTTIAVTATPATAKAYVGLVLRATAGQSGDVILVRRASIHRGAAGVWSLPGLPITGQSPIAVNNAVDLSGTGSPEGVVTAAPGSTWLQTDATTDVKGWIRWVKATGTGNTGWVAGPEADTGWRDVATDASGLTGSSITAQIRRTGATVAYRLSFAQSGAASGVTVVSAAGFRGTAPTTYVPIYGNNAGAVVGAAEVGSATVKVYTTASGNGGTVSADVMYSTSDAWPSSLPGSAA